MTSSAHGGRRYLPFAFTEHGVLMAANVLNSERAIKTSVALIEAFIRLRAMALSVEELSRKVGAIERRYDEQFKVVFDAIRQLLAPPGGSWLVWWAAAGATAARTTSHNSR